MDIASIIGIIGGFGTIAWGILIGSSLLIFWNLPSVVIVIGGTLAATMLGFPLKDMTTALKSSKKVFMYKIAAPDELVNFLLDISTKARKSGLLSIEAELKNIDDPYLKSALQMTVDGMEIESIESVMQNTIDLTRKDGEVGPRVFTTMGGYAPGFGMLGTLIGLIQMLSTLDDPSTIGPKMSVAMITTFYGSFIANVFLLPFADKLKKVNDEKITNMEILREGVLSIRAGEHPRILGDKLKMYLSEDKQNEMAEG